jgi:hypothetical protein
MTKYKKTELVLNKEFNPQSRRHLIGGLTVVLHCHHYASLYTQLAMDCSMLDAKALLAECSEDTWEEFLREYFRAGNITSLGERMALAEQAFAAAGLGRMHVDCASAESGEVTLEHSHVDEGWLKKWGRHSSPVNFISAGFIAALFSAVFNLPVRSFAVAETQAIVCGAPRSRFTVVRR